MSILRTCQSVVTLILLLFFFFNDTATTEIYTLSLHDALPISSRRGRKGKAVHRNEHRASRYRKEARGEGEDRKSTRLNSSHGYISYAVFCLKKKKRESSNTAEEHR